MDSRLHNQQQQQRREARRGGPAIGGPLATAPSGNPRAFSPQQHHHHQFVPLPHQQLPPSSHYPQQQTHHQQQQQQHHHLPHNHQHHPQHHHVHQHQQQQHRLSSVPSASGSLLDDSSRRFPTLASRTAPNCIPVPIDHSDYASIIAYRQRVNGLPSPHQSTDPIVPSLSRNQSSSSAAVWPPDDRLRNSSDSRHSLEDASRHSRLLPFAKDTRDDHRSMSELDSSRRSAALSAKLFLDERRCGRLTSQRGVHYEPAPPEASRRHVDKVELCSEYRGSQSLAERLRKRLRDESPGIDKDRNSRHRRFYDPGLAVLPRTPETPRNVPLVRRVVSSSRLSSRDLREFTDRNENQNAFHRSRSPNERHNSPYISPSKSSKKKQQRRSLPLEGGLTSPKLSLVQRLEDPEKKTNSAKDPSDTNKKIRSSQSLELQPREKPVTTKADTSTLSVADKYADSPSKFVVAEPSSTPSSEELEAGEWKPKDGSRKHHKPVGKALRVVESSPRTKNVKSRVVRLISSDAKVCAGSSKSRLSQTDTSCNVLPNHGTVDCTAMDNTGSVNHDPAITNINSRNDMEVSKAIEITDDACLSPENQIRSLSNSQGLACSLGETPSLPLQHERVEKSEMPLRDKEETRPLTCHTSEENSVLSKHKGSMPLGITTADNQPINMQPESEVHVSSSIIKHDESLISELKKAQVKEFLPLKSENSFSLSQLCSQSMHRHECSGSNVNDTDNVNKMQKLPVLSLLQNQSDISSKDLNSSYVSIPNMLDLTGVPKNNGYPNSVRKETLGNLPSENIVEREVRLFGKSLKASVPNATQDKGQTVSALSCELISKVDREQNCTIVTDGTEPKSFTSLLTRNQQSSTSFPSKTVTGTVCQIDDISQEQSVLDESIKDTPDTASIEAVKPPTSTVPTSAIQCKGPMNDLSKESGEQRATADLYSSPMVSEHYLDDQLTKKVTEPISNAPNDGVSKPDHTAPLIIQSQPVITDSLERIQEGNSTVIRNDIMDSGDKEFESKAKKCLRNSNAMASNYIKEDVNNASDMPAVGNSGKSDPSSAEKILASTPAKQFSATIHPAGKNQNISSRVAANTWRRSANLPNTSATQSMSKVPKPPFSGIQSAGAATKVSDAPAYVRKGNSLVRASVASTLPHPPLAVSTPPIGLVKDIVMKGFPNVIRGPNSYPGFRKAINSTKSVFRHVFSAQKTSPGDGALVPLNGEKPTAVPSVANLPRDAQGGTLSNLSTKPAGQAASESLPGSSVPQIVGSDDQRLHVAVSETNNKQALPIAQLSNVFKKPDMSTVYIKNKANQLIASLPPIPFAPSGTVNITTAQSSGKVQMKSNSSAATQDVYYKRKKNQLVRNGLDTKNTALLNKSTGLHTQGVRESTVKKALRRRYLPQSRVWTLKDGSASQVKSVLPLLFPWKRPGIGLSVRAGRFKALPKAKKGSLLFLISKKLQRLRKVQPVYSRSAGGFSLHRSGVLSLSGANLKWTKSIEKRSKQASEEATKAVAAVEKQRREKKAAVAKAVSAVAKAKPNRRASHRASHSKDRIVMVGFVRYKMDSSGRTLQRLPDQWCDGSTGAPSVSRKCDSAMLSTPRRLSLDGTQYVRLGNGNQLIRDPKAVSRALASEKIRWSLHTARSRRAKKQQYCLFFTRFGKCNKSEGECPYIHDQEKVAICTKFLKGNCSGSNCLFSHKVIPERMPDCSFFLEGICTNENCPYRHVSVNPKAPVCEGFLKGFCADGDECKRKHSTICPSFAATGECPDKSTCKLHHPKKKRKRAFNTTSTKSKSKRKRRYFGSGSNEILEQVGTSPSDDTLECADIVNLDLIKVPDVILDTDEVDEYNRKFSTLKEQLPFLQDAFQKESDLWIKPILLLKKPIST